MDLANMRQNGVQSLAVQCRQCLHEVIMNVDQLPGDVTLPSLRVHEMWDHRRRRAAELAGESEAMKRPAKQSSPPASKSNKWNIYHIKGKPAVLLGQVQAPDEEPAIKRAIEEFKISPTTHREASA
jgi:hypothetical protein